MNQNRLTVVADEKGLGCTFYNTLKFGVHCAKATAKANSELGVIKRTFSNLSRYTVDSLTRTTCSKFLQDDPLPL